MAIIVTLKNIFILLIVFSIGVIASYSYLTDEQFTEDLLNLSGTNLLSPVAILFSALIASTVAHIGFHENNKRHQKEETMKVLRYKRFTWPALRALVELLNHISSRRETLGLNSPAFDQFIKSKRETCTLMKQLISFLDSYQNISVGIKNGIYNEDVAKLIIGRQLCFIYQKSRDYIDWRRETDLDDGPANHSGMFSDLETLSIKWKKEFDKTDKKAEKKHNKKIVNKLKTTKKEPDNKYENTADTMTY